VNLLIKNFATSATAAEVIEKDMAGTVVAVSISRSRSAKRERDLLLHENRAIEIGKADDLSLRADI
jgi:hypothetical protein